MQEVEANAACGPRQRAVGWLAALSYRRRRGCL